MHRRRRSRGRVGVLWILASVTSALMLTGCDVASMAFFQDDRVRIVEPQEGGTVELPVTLRWEVEGFTVTGPDGHARDDAGYFAVFVDRHPIPPGRTLEWYAQQEDSCGGSACASVDNLAQVYATVDTTVELTQLPAIRDTGGRELHTVRIVLLDGTGARIGESAFRVQFNFEREE